MKNKVSHSDSDCAVQFGLCVRLLGRPSAGVGGRGRAHRVAWVRNCVQVSKLILRNGETALSMPARLKGRNTPSMVCDG